MIFSEIQTLSMMQEGKKIHKSRLEESAASTRWMGSSSMVVDQNVEELW